MTPTPIYTSGREASGFNLVFVANNAKTTFEATNAARSFLTKLYGEPWWPKVFQAVNIFAIDDTAQFRTSLPIVDDGRLLNYDATALRAFVVAHGVPNVTATALACADAGGGRGSGTPGSFAFSTLGWQWESLALHEFGHCCGLGDEYAPASGVYTGPEPHWQNLTIETDRNKIKWRHLFNPKDIPIPTLTTAMMSHPPIPPNAIGLFEGGGTKYRSGIYRPGERCRMLGSNLDPYCAVCEDAIVTYLSQWLPGGVVVPPMPPAQQTITLRDTGGTSFLRIVSALPKEYVLLDGARLFVRRAGFVTMYDEQGVTVLS